MQMNQRLVMRNQFAAGLLQHSAGHHVLWLRITEPLTDKHTRSGIADVASGVMNAH